MIPHPPSLIDTDEKRPLALNVVLVYPPFRYPSFLSYPLTFSVPHILSSYPSPESVPHILPTTQGSLLKV
jgi:hypothetical protein